MSSGQHPIFQLSMNAMSFSPSLPVIATVFLAFLLIGYRSYSRKLIQWLDINPKRPTPAHEKRDEVDYVPTPPQYLFGQHFSAIAAAGPVAGPIAAALTFGWLPCLLWIALGVVFVGGLSIVLGYRARIGAWLLVVALALNAWLMHNFWDLTETQSHAIQQIMFMKNLSLIGGALMIAYFGAGPVSLDERKNTGV